MIPLKKIGFTTKMIQLTKYERTRLLGTRALQIAMNSQILVDTHGETDPLKIAIMEFDQKVLPLKVRRVLPNGEVKLFSVQELIL